jgi:hypothetical protein
MSRSVLLSITFLAAVFVGMTLIYGQESVSGRRSVFQPIDRAPELDARVRQRVPAEVYGVTDIVTQGLEDPKRGLFQRQRKQIRVTVTHNENDKKTAREVILLLEDTSDAEEILRLIRQFAKQHGLETFVVESAAPSPDTGRLMFGVGVNSDSGVTSGIVLDEAGFDLSTLDKPSVRLKQSLDELRNELQSLRKDIAALRELLEKKP